MAFKTTWLGPQPGTEEYSIDFEKYRRASAGDYPSYSGGDYGKVVGQERYIFHNREGRDVEVRKEDIPQGTTIARIPPGAYELQALSGTPASVFDPASGVYMTPEQSKFSTATQAASLAEAQKLGVGKFAKVDLAKPISTDILKDDKGEADALIKESGKMEEFKTRVIEIYNERPDALANKDYIQAVAQAKFGRPATADELKHISQGGAVGGSLRDVLGRFGLLEGTADIGVGFEIPEGKQQIKSPADRKNFIEGTIAEDPTGTFLYGTPKAEATTEAPPPFAGGEGAEPSPAQPEIKTGGDAISEMYDSLIGTKLEGMQGVDTDEYLAKKQAAGVEVEKARQAIVDKKLIDAVTLEGISKDQAIPMALISRQQGQYSTDEYITNLKMTQNYNNKLILSKMAEGNFLEVQRINKDIANDNYEIQKLQLDKLYYEESIADKEYERMQKDIEWERELAMDGYSHIPDMETYDKIVKEYGITPANFGSFIYKEGNKMYLRPLDEVDTQIITAGGRSLLINKQTGDTIKDLGYAYKTGGGVSGAGVSSFTKIQKQKLEQAGLSEASRQEQLNFLYQKPLKPQEIETETRANYKQKYIDAGYSEEEANERLTELWGEAEEEETKLPSKQEVISMIPNFAKQYSREELENLIWDAGQNPRNWDISAALNRFYD